MEYMWIIWLVSAILFAIIEMTNASFFMIWFSVGALAAMIISLLIPSIVFQLLVFLVVSVILLVSTRKITKNFMHSKSSYKSNIDKIKNSQGIVIEEIDNTKGTGQVRANGELWSALSSSDTIIAVNTKIIVINVKGVKLVVEEDITV